MNKIKKYILLLLLCILPFSMYVKADTTPGEILLEKTAIKEDPVYGRSASVKLKVSANGFTKVNKTDVVLVLDESTSMNNKKMIAAKEAAKVLINALITDTTKNSVRVGISSFGKTTIPIYSTTNLTNDAPALLDLIDSIPAVSNNAGTNIHSGLKTAYKLFPNEETDKIIILLSDGEPNLFDGNNKICRDNRTDRNDKNCKITINNIEYNKPNTVAVAYASSIKNNVKIYTIGFDIKNNETAQNILKEISTDPKTYSYLAEDYKSLEETFKKIAKQISLIATNAIVTDIVPAGFNANVEENVIKKVNDDNTTTLTWNIGDIKSTENYILEYTTEAKEDYYGSMFTNTSATLRANPVEGNPKYKENIFLNFDKPIVNIPAITVNDDYTSKKILQNDSIKIDSLNGLLSNDKMTHIYNDVDKKIINKIVLDNSKNITVLDDGSFIFDAKVLGKNIFKYYIETTISNGNEKDIVKSNTSTITFFVDKKPMKYVVNYLEKDTNKVLFEKKEISNVYLNDFIREYPVNIKGYSSNELNKTLIINEENNVINFYYKKINNLEATINYYEENTTKKIANSKKLIDLVYLEKILETPIDIIGYDKIDEPKELIVDIENNVINFYYKKSTGKVKILYIDSSNKEISSATILEGMLDESYKTNSKEIKDYKLINVIGEEEGSYKLGEVIVKYVYEKVPHTGIYVKNVSYIIPTVSLISLSILGIIKKFNK